jgi:hypothetical protein
VSKLKYFSINVYQGGGSKAALPGLWNAVNKRKYFNENVYQFDGTKAAISGL